MTKTHYDPSLNARDCMALLVTSVPLHKTAYAGGVNGIEATNHVPDVTCAICLRKMQSPGMIGKFRTDELADPRYPSV